MRAALRPARADEYVCRNRWVSRRRALGHRRAESCARGRTDSRTTVAGARGRSPPLVAVLRRIAPEIDAGSLDPTADFRAAGDLDSVDLLNLLVAVQEETGVEVPDRVAGDLTSVTALASYIAEHA